MEYAAWEVSHRNPLPPRSLISKFAPGPHAAATRLHWASRSARPHGTDWDRTPLPGYAAQQHRDPRVASARRGPGPAPPGAILRKVPCQSRWVSSSFLVAAGAGLSSSHRVVLRLAAINSKSGSDWTTVIGQRTEISTASEGGPTAESGLQVPPSPDRLHTWSRRPRGRRRRTAAAAVT